MRRSRALTRERALASEAAQWVADWERHRRAGARKIVVEAEGKLELSINGRPFTLTAKADRIEPTPATLMTGGSPARGTPTPGELTYVRVTGRRPAGEEQVRALANGESAEAARKAMDGLVKLIARYDRSEERRVGK